MSLEFIGQAVPPKDIVTVILVSQAGSVTSTPLESNYRLALTECVQPSRVGNGLRAGNGIVKSLYIRGRTTNKSGSGVNCGYS